jgi:hypothetical protein
MVSKSIKDKLRILYKRTFVFQKKLIKQWRNDINKHRVKDKALISLSEIYKLTNIVETGTDYGETLWALQPYFKSIISIELENVRYYSSKYRFRKFSNIKILHGDSAEILQMLIKEINEPTLFWLDAHYDGGNTALGKYYTPICAELATILGSKFDHIILIDDANTFINQLRPDYPTVDEIREIVKGYKKDYHVYVKNNMIWLEKCLSKLYKYPENKDT